MTDQTVVLNDHERWLVRHCGPNQNDYQDVYVLVTTFVRAHGRYPSVADPTSGSPYPKEHAERLLACRVESVRTGMRYGGLPAVRQLFELLPGWSWTPRIELEDE